MSRSPPATCGRRWTVTGVLAVAAVLYRTLAESESLLVVIGAGTVGDIALLATVILLAEVVRGRRALRAQAREQERLRIARELHDVLAHTIAVINVQAGVADDVLGSDPEQARASLRAIREQARDATGELRATIGVLRRPGEERPEPPAPRLAQLGELAEAARRAGCRVELSVSGSERPLPAAVELTAYRVVQESLTNVVRHAGASTASIRMSYEPTELVVEISDDGRAPARVPEGHGIAGMRERVVTLGGSFEAGAGPAGGFRVRASLPT